MGFYQVGPALREGRRGAEIQVRCHRDLTESGVRWRGSRVEVIGVGFDSEVIEKDVQHFNLSFNYGVINLAGSGKIKVSLRGKR